MRACHLLLLLAAVTPLAAQDSGVASVSVAGSIQLDGRLDEPAWQDTQAAVFTQQSPRPGQPTPYHTEVRVLRTADQLYFGFLCRDPRPDRAVHTMRRDGEMVGDDTVSIVLDTFGDRRTGYFFQINAAGARADGLINDPERVSLDWDGVWDARTASLPDGWSAEIVVPSRTLNFTPGLSRWGINAERFVARDRITLRLASPTLDSFFYDLSRAAPLTGVGDLRQGAGIEFSPYLLGRTVRPFQSDPRSYHGSGGLDFTWRLTPQLAAVFTANTDFAETEVDARQINLTRFPLFFPEKRTFFLEGSNQFDFGLGLGRDFIPFFSRRIGLLGDRQVPLNGGVKLNGRHGDWNLALLDVQTRETPFAPAANLLAGRVSYDLTKQLRMGTIFTNGDPRGQRRNTLLGWDGVYRTSGFRGDKNFLAGAWVAVNAGEVGAGDRTGWGFKIDYPNDTWDCATTVLHLGDALAPALGFLPRPGVRRSIAKCDFMPRPARDGSLGFIRQFFFEANYSRVDNLRGFNESWALETVPFAFQTESGDRFDFEWSPQFEFLPGPFRIVENVIIPPGSYRFTRWKLDLQSSRQRLWQAGTAATFGTFYSGHLTQWEHHLNWTSPKGRLQLGLSAEQDFGRLPEGSFAQRLWQLQSAFAWNPDLVLTSFIQYDTESRNLGSNTRLRWTVKPGNDIFVVWTRSWQHLVMRRDDLTLAPEEELLAVKVRWTFRR